VGRELYGLEGDKKKDRQTDKAGKEKKIDTS